MFPISDPNEFDHINTTIYDLTSLAVVACSHLAAFIPSLPLLKVYTSGIH